MESVEYNGSIVLSTETDNALSESCLVLRKFLEDGYSVDVHPHMNENCLVEFLLIDIYDEKLSSEEFSADYHAAAKVGAIDNEPKEVGELLSPEEVSKRIDVYIAKIEQAVGRAKKNAKQNPK